MMAVVALSNYLVQFPVNEWLTWGAFTYPVCYLVSELTNRALGPEQSRKVAWVGFALALVLSLWVATPRIAAASGCAFLLSQLLDIAIFNRLRRQAWWRAPLAGAGIASVIDTAIFFSLAFAGTEMNWLKTRRRRSCRQVVQWQRCCYCLTAQRCGAFLPSRCAPLNTFAQTMIGVTGLVYEKLLIEIEAVALVQGIGTC